MVLSLDLSHNDPERLFKEFLNPLAEFFPRKDKEDTTIVVKVQDRREFVGERIAIVEIEPFSRVEKDPWCLATWTFYSDTAHEGEDGGDFSWSDAGQKIVEVILQQMRQEIKRVDERVKPALVKMEESFPSLREVFQI